MIAFALSAVTARNEVAFSGNRRMIDRGESIVSLSGIAISTMELRTGLI
jgi:hypothetical protein